MVFLTLFVGSTWGKPGTFLVETKDAAVEPNGYKGGPKDYRTDYRQEYRQDHSQDYQVWSFEENIWKR